MDVDGRWQCRLTSYRLGAIYHCHADDVSPGARLARPQAQRRPKRNRRPCNEPRSFWAEQNDRRSELQYRGHAEIGLVQRFLNQRLGFNFRNSLGDSQFAHQQVTRAVQHFLLAEGERFLVLQH